MVENGEGNSKMIFGLCVIYAIHMVEEFSLGFVEWADVYFGKFDWTQNLVGNSMYMILLFVACLMYCRDPRKYLWLGMSGVMWILANFFIHASATILGRQYSPGMMTAALLYFPVGCFFLVKWGRARLFDARNLSISISLGAFGVMLIPTFVRAVIFHAKLAQVFHLVS